VNGLDWKPDGAKLRSDEGQARSDPRGCQHRSIAWGIAKACHAAWAEIALTWQGDALKKRVEPLAKELEGLLLGHCDVTDPSTIDAVFEVLKEKWGKIDFVVHAIAFSDKDQARRPATWKPRRIISPDHADQLLLADRDSPSAPKSFWSTAARS